jgi:hypothetical protein
LPGLAFASAITSWNDEAGRPGRPMMTSGSVESMPTGTKSRWVSYFTACGLTYCAMAAGLSTAMRMV